MEPKPTPPNFLNLLEEVYQKEDKKREENAKEGFRHNPSSASFTKKSGETVGACVRALYYKATKEPKTEVKPLTVSLQGDFGNGIHDRVTEQLKKSDKIKIIPESPGKVVVDELTNEVSYRLDGLITHKGEEGYLEIKTMQSFALRNMVKSGAPRDKDVLQVLSCLGAKPELRWAALVYFGRDNAYRAEYHIYKDPETGTYVFKGITPTKHEQDIDELSFEGIVSRWKELEVAVATQKLPKRDFKAVLKSDGTVTDKRVRNYVEYKTASACMYCSWQTKCWTSEGAEEDSVKIGS